ncbi:MAG: NYN domain-containing protein [Chloroflexi bacterium]|nr:NYN domain-containing protein [Chloroflexota bacterium]
MSKVAILIDGGYFLKRLPSVRPDIDASDPKAVVGSIRQLVRNHLSQLNNIHHATNFYSLLYRCFYYDALPYGNKGQRPVSKRPINFATSELATFRNGLFDALREQSSFALRLGEVRKPSNNSWILKPSAQKRLLRGDIDTAGLIDGDFMPDLHQKGVDMRIGLDIASITLKRQADTIILVSGDSDFVPAAKLARREGVIFILDPLWQRVSNDLLEHIDGLRSGFYNPDSRNA